MVQAAGRFLRRTQKKFERDLRGNLAVHVVPRFLPDVGRDLAERAPCLGEWVRELPVLQGISLEDHEIRHRENEQWFQVPEVNGNGFYQFWPRYRGEGLYGWEIRGAPQFHALFDADRNLWQSGRWYDLRFAGRLTTGEKCVVTYSPQKKKLAVPESWRFPVLYETILILCSGLLPRRLHSGGTSFLVYENVSEVVVDRFAHLQFHICNFA